MSYTVFVLAVILFLTPAVTLAQGVIASTGASAPAATPAFYPVPELMSGFHQLYEQKFDQARATFGDWHSKHPEEPFGEVSVAASFLFEELYRQGVLTSDFFLNERKFLHGIDGKPDSGRMNNFRDALTRSRVMAKERLKTNPKDAEALFALTLAAGMESDADAILEKRQLDGLKRMKEANEYAKELLAVHPDAADAYVAPGIANYIIGSLNPGYRFALWFGGIHGDKKLGMEQVGKTVADGRYLRPFAKIMLALAARREKQNELAQNLLRELTQEFPSNDTFAAEYAKAMGLPVPAVLTR
jgi:tetratricopeptide (TPR) repeat protein